MRIAINAAAVGKRHSGVGTYTAGLIRSLRELGHELVVYASSPHITACPGIKVARTSTALSFDELAISGLLRLAWNNLVLPMRLLLAGVDVVVAQNADGAFWSPVPQFVVVHDLIPLLYPDEAPRLHTFYKIALPLVLRRSTGVIAVSEYTQQDLLQRYRLNRSKVTIAYNGVDCVLDPALEQRPPALLVERYFLFVGTYAPRKNLETVIKALAAVRDQIQESLVIVAYPDKWMPEFLRSIEDLKLSDRVILLTDLRGEEMAYLYRHATALFLLSEYEGFGFPAVEAILFGTVAVVSDRTALAEVAGDAAIKIGARDDEAAGEIMLRLSTDQTYRQELQQVGIQRGRTFTWIRSGAAVEDVLSQITQGRLH